MLFTFDYDVTYPGPAFPVVEINLYALGHQSDPISAFALVDSGADATMIPLHILEKLEVRRVDRMRMRGVGGNSQFVDIYEVALEIGSFTIPKVYAAADTFNTEILLGRDVLNQFVITLNGLAAIVEVSQ